MADITKYMIQLIPSSINIENKSNKDLINELKKDNLYLKIVNFYSQLKHSNQKLSEGKISCPVYITWTTDVKIPPINSGQARYLLKLISFKTYFGRLVELSNLYLQELKFDFTFKSKGLQYHTKFV